MRALIMLAVVVVPTQLILANEFQRDDSILILVAGPAEISTPWGLSGKASMYRATSTQTSGNLGFSEVSGAQDIVCERRSAKKVTKAFDYSTSGQIPPGVYFLSYHRLDPSGKRHRLAIGDTVAGTKIRVMVNGADVTRTDIQFHEAANDLRSYTPQLSEGCIIFSKENFETLFPKGFLESNSSPLPPSQPKLESAQEFKGAGRVLVFVTDITDRSRSEKQIQLFESVVSGGDQGLDATSFSNDSKRLAEIRLRWAMP